MSAWEGASFEVYESVVTYEGPSSLSLEERVLNGTVLKDIKNACDDISAHFKSLDIHLTKCIFYFKHDSMGDLNLLYATNIKTWEFSSPYTLGDSELKLTIPVSDLALKQLIKLHNTWPQTAIMRGGKQQIFCPFCEQHI